MNKKEPLILGIGEVLWDMLPDGKRCGGAPANVIYHLTQLGNCCAIVSAVGKDAAGDELVNFLESKGLSTEFITRNALPTGTVNVAIENGIPQYEICRPAAWDAITVSSSLAEKIPFAAAMIWGTLAQRDRISRHAVQTLLAAAPSDCLKCFDINIRQDYYSAAVIDESLQFADVLKINEEEVGITAEQLHIAGTRENILAELYRRYGLKYIICTLGASGSMLFDGDRFTAYPVKPCRVADTVGCGDAFLAAWCHAVLHGKSAEEGMFAGTELSAKTAGHAGAMP